MKFMVYACDGQPGAEVRIDGVRHAAGSAALLALPWPKDGAWVARVFVLFVHPIDR